MAKACASSDSHAWRSITKVKKKGRKQYDLEDSTR